MPRTPAPRGRPSIITHGEIEDAAFRLFAQQGFEATTLDAISAEAGVARRTLARYYPSKNDIPWGQFDQTLGDFRAILESLPSSLPLWRRVHQGVLAFNTYPDEVLPAHRQRLELILRTPALQAHSALRYAEWRQVIADHVATDRGVDPTSLEPRLVGRVSLALAVTAYDQWLDHPGSDLLALLDASLFALRAHFDG
ncbi:mycofactocin system transcriptional regulator [Janibacter terrae]|uniref:mycofactocin system transcriptional regulator n=1 Tax=Janibacter terrae TaxID=103817 RepID=UPI000838758D|nr:mycofactocin system transcriptional regulator [Janibacter terrae]MBA4084554.1 mycofactocin system transcriptional regulator [Kytococcus sp.]